ncbi:MAG: DUF3726 domain-containing protein [Arenicellales bacterium]
MHLSLNQVEHTARKAVRGAGLLWGLAEDAGRAVRWLEAVDLHGASKLVSLLQKIDHSQLVPLKIVQQNGHWKAQSGKASPLIVGPSIADCANAGSLGAAGNQEIYDDRILAIENIAYPLLVAGFAGVAATQCDRWIRLTWGEVKVYCCPDGLGFSGNRKELDAESTGKLEVQLLEPDEVVMHVFWPLSHDACSLRKADWEALESYAHLTYVEASAASRIAGAGAGLNDND